MSTNNLAPPESEAADSPLATAPKQVTSAVKLLWLSLFLGIPVLVIDLSRTPIDVAYFVSLVFQIGLILAAAYLNVCVARGRNWARITLLILAVLGTALLAFFDMPEATVIEYVLNGMGSALDIVAMYLLFLTPGKLWFRAVAHNEA
jgi:hypothetical protein